MTLQVLSLGWGVQSWTLAAMSALGELPPLDYAIHADTTHEQAGTYAHAAEWTPWLEERHVPVVTVSAARPDVVREDWSGSVMIPAFTRGHDTGKLGQVRRQCTHDWKIMPIRRYLRGVLGKLEPGAVDMWVGISLDEAHRMRDSDVAYIRNVYPLVERRITRADCILWLERHGLSVPPKSACTFCPYSSLGAWRARKRAGGADWQEAVAVDTAIRRKRSVHGAALFLHPARAPLEEAVTILEDYGARQLRLDMDYSCESGYCMT